MQHDPQNILLIPNILRHVILPDTVHVKRLSHMLLVKIDIGDRIQTVKPEQYLIL